MITARDLVFKGAVKRFNGDSDVTVETYEIGKYKVTRTIYADGMEFFDVHIDRSDRENAEYLPMVYINYIMDINGNICPPRVSVQTVSYGALHMDDYERYFMQIRDGYETARILEQKFCGKEN